MKTSEILDSKAKASLAGLNAPKPEDAAKAVPFQEKAKEVISKTEEIVKYLEELKARTLAASMKGNSTGDGFEEFMENGKALLGRRLHRCRCRGSPCWSLSARLFSHWTCSGHCRLHGHRRCWRNWTTPRHVTSCCNGQKTSRLPAASATTLRCLIP